jgi:hypothetical protein
MSTDTTGIKTTKKGSSVDLGGLFSSLFGGRQQRKIAEENRRWQAEQNTLAYERSLPWSSQGPAGDVEFDSETKEMLQTLSPEYQQLMNQWLGTADMSTTELQSMMGDPYAMEQQQFQRFEDLNKSAYARSRAQGQESALARGMQGTQSYYDQMAIEDSINQSRLGGQLAAMGTGMNYRQMLGQEALGFGGGAMNIAGMLTPQADLGRLLGQGAHTGVNMEGLSLAGTNLADTKSGFWSGMQDQAALYNNQGDMTQAAQTGWFNQLIGAGKKGWSMLTDDNRNNRNSNIV